MNAVRLLLDQGSDIEGKDANGQTPLDIASRNDRTEIALLLIRRGALVSESAIAEAPNVEMRDFLEGMAERPRLGFEFGKTFDIRKASGAEYPGGIGSQVVEIQMLGEDGQWTTVVPEAFRWDLPFAIFRAVATE